MEELIELVHQSPCLWNLSLKDYRDSAKKEAAWQSIVNKLRDKSIPDIDTAKIEWKKLRDTHRDSLKRAKTAGVNHWKYAEIMEFLLPHMKNRPRASDLNSESFVECLLSTDPCTDDAFVNESQPSPSHETSGENSNRQRFLQPQLNEGNSWHHATSRKRKADSDVIELIREMDPSYNCRCEERIQRRMVPMEQRHPLDSFFESMCETTKRFPEWLQRQVKKNVFKVVTDAEESIDSHAS